MNGDENPNGESMAPMMEERTMVTSLLGSQERTAVDVIVDRLLGEHESVIELQGEVEKAERQLDQTRHELDRFWGEAKERRLAREERLKQLDDSNLVSHAKRELRAAGFYDSDADYGPGELAGAVMGLVETFALQGHSGMSASIVTEVVNKLLRFEPLTPITSDPDEWNEVGEATRGQALWQSRRNPTVFSEDGGETWYTIDASQASFGDRAMDGGVMGTIVRCEECGGSGQLHAPDETPGQDEPEEPKDSGLDEDGECSDPSCICHGDIPEDDA